MNRYRKKPVVIEAVQWDGSDASTQAVLRFAAGLAQFRSTPKPGGGYNDRIVIFTLEGDHNAAPGDWIIRGVQGEFYPCKPDIFAQTYEPAPTTQEQGREEVGSPKLSGETK